MWSGERLTGKQLTSRPDHLWPERWEKMGKNAKLKEKQKWSHEKPLLDNARKLRGIYFIDPEDKEFKETIENARKKLETSVAPAMQCKIIKNNKNCVVVHPTKSRQNLRVFWKLMNPQDCVWENHCRLIMKTILQEKETIHHSTTIWFTSFSYASSHEDSSSKGSSGQGMGEIGKIPAWDLTKVRSEKEVIDEARTKGAKVHFASLMDICHLKNAELEAKHQKYKGRVVLRGDIVKDDSGSYAAFTEQGSSAS